MKISALLSRAKNHHWFLIALMTLCLIPGGFVRSIINMDHFYSSIHLFEYAFRHHFLFGVQLIDNVGPYGFLHYPYLYSGDYFWAKMLIYFLNCLLFSYYTTQLINQLKSWPEKILFLFTAILFVLHIDAPWFSFEVIPRLTILFSALYFLNDLNANRTELNTIAHIVTNSIYYAFLVLEKASNVYYIFLIMMVLAIQWSIQKQYRYMVWMLGTFSFSIFLLWLMAGQQISTLFVYFHAMRGFIDAYQNYFSDEMPSNLFRYAVFYCVLSMALMFWRIYLSRNIHEFLGSILISALIFLSWKHGMPRSYNSYGIFLYTMPCLLAYLYFYPIRGDGLHPNRTLRGVGYLGLLIVFGMNLTAYGRPFHDLFHELEHRFSLFIHYRPLEIRERFHAELKQLKQAHLLPDAIRTKINHASVDQYGDAPEIILLNQLTYHPRPIPIHFIVANRQLNQINGHYYQNKTTAPQYIFYPYQFGLELTDTQAYLSLLLNYKVNDYVDNQYVLEKKSSSWQNIKFVKRVEKQVHLGKWVRLHELQNQFLWLEIDLKPSWLGNLKNMLYKSDSVILETQLKHGAIERYAISLGQLNSGFLINPRIKWAGPLKYAYVEGKVPWNQVRAFRITVNKPKNKRLFQWAFNMTLYDVITNASILRLDNAQNIMTIFDEQTQLIASQFPLNVLDNQSVNHYTTGLANLEKNGADSWRWATGSQTTLGLYVKKSQQQLLQLQFKNILKMPEQTITIDCNGQVLRYISANELNTTGNVDVVIPINLKQGINMIHIRYTDWNHKTVDYAPFDYRQLAVLVSQFKILEYKDK